MKSMIYIGSIAVSAVLLFNSCTNNKPQIPAKNIAHEYEKQEITRASNSKKGQHVPNQLVCMVNDEYMGKQQIEVPFEGKMFYGCCDMCKERIPVDESVRFAIDPHSLKKISKADAYIVVISDQDDVAYFENEGSYQAFIQ